MKKVIWFAFLLTALWAVVGTAAFGRAGTPRNVSQTSPGSLVISDRTIDCGAASLTVSGTGWSPGKPLEVWFVGEQLPATTNSQGGFSTTITPSEAPAGQHTLRAIQGGRQASAMVSCVAEQAGTVRAGVVAFSGANITVGFLILVGLLMATGITLALGRRRA